MPTHLRWRHKATPVGTAGAVKRQGARQQNRAAYTPDMSQMTDDHATVIRDMPETHLRILPTRTRTAGDSRRMETASRLRGSHILCRPRLSAQTLRVAGAHMS